MSRGRLPRIIVFPVSISELRPPRLPRDLPRSGTNRAAGRAPGPRAADNIAARGSESDTVNPLTRLLRVLLLEPSCIIVATSPGSPWHSYHQKYRWKACARAFAIRYPLSRFARSFERASPRETSKSYFSPLYLPCACESERKRESVVLRNYIR